MNPETKFKLKVQKYLKVNCPKAFLWKTADMFTSGIPDQHMTWKGKSFWFELKAGKNKASKAQKAQIAKINKAGGFAGVAYTIDDIKEIIGRAGL